MDNMNSLLFISCSGLWLSLLDWHNLTILQTIALGITLPALLTVAFQLSLHERR